MKMLMNTLILTLAGIAFVTSVGCTGSGRPELHKEPAVEIITDMQVQPALKAQDEEPYEPGKAASRLPPEGSVPQGYTPYKYKLNPSAAEQNLKNPLAGDMSPEILALGQSKYEIYCLVCHGAKGLGDGSVSVKMSFKPPPLVSDKVINFNDGRIFHIISDGQGVMSSYAFQLVNERDRWAIVNYVRSLQKMKTGQ